MIIKYIQFAHPMLSNCWLIADEETKEAAIIDAASYSEEMKQAINDIEGIKLKYILQTHGHFDHILGIYDLKNAYDIKTAIHELDAECLFDEQKSLACDFAQCRQKPVKPDILLRDGDELMLGNQKIKVMHTPGHTPGSVCYILENDRVIFSGDTLFCRTVGRTDFPGGSFEQLVRSIKKLIALEGDYTVFPGHNRSTTLNSERERNRIIRRM